MTEIVSYQIKPTKLVPNSPHPVLHYKKYFSVKDDGKVDASLIYDTFKHNGWDVQWVARYGKYQRSHYHPETHEVMAVLSGPGTIRWGVADTDDDEEKHTYGEAFEDGGLVVEAEVGDVFLVPAGVAHKSFDPSTPTPNVQSLAGGLHGIEGEDPSGVVDRVSHSGFMMMGAYPQGLDWSWSEGGEHLAQFDAIWKVPKPDLDPLEGTRGALGVYWK